MEKTSALMDSELDARQAQSEIARLEQDPQARSNWETYHLIGDVMRGNRMAGGGIARKVSEQLAREPTVLAPQRSRPSRTTAYALSAAASVSAVALVGWMALNSSPREEQIAAPSAPTSAPQSAPQLASVPYDGKMNDYLIAHQEFSANTSGLAGYIRTIAASPGDGGRVVAPEVADTPKQ